MPRTLIIDDDHDICFLLNKFLTKHGFAVSEALTSKKAIELLDEHADFDVVYVIIGWKVQMEMQCCGK